MASIFRCPECQQPLQVRDEMRGKKIRCPKCKAVTMAPAAEEAIVVEAVDDEAFSEEPPRRRPRDDEPPRRRRDSDDDSRRRRHRDDDRLDLDDVGAGKRSMPSSVVLAVVALSVILGLEVLLGVMALALTRPAPEQMGPIAARTGLIVVIGGLILWGLIAGHRLAWQWGRVLGMIGAIVLLLVGVLAVTAPQADMPPGARYLNAVLSLVVSACLFTIAFSLGALSAKKYFNLRCPSCGRFTSSAADFFFNKAKCKRCREVW